MHEGIVSSWILLLLCDHSCRYNIYWLCHSWRYICQLDFSAVIMATSAEAFVNCLWCMQLHLLTLFCYNC